MAISKIKKNIILYILMVFIFFDYSIQLTLGYLGNRLPIKVENFGNYSFYVFIILMVVLIGRDLIPKKKNYFILALAYLSFVLLYYFYTTIVSPSSLEIDISNFSLGKLLSYFFVTILVFMHDADYELLLKWLVNAARILSIVVFLIFFVDYIRQGFTYAGYNMVLGYQAALSAIILLYSIVYKKESKLFRIVDIVELVVMIAVTSFGGSRGSILTIVVYVLAIVFKNLILNRDLLTKVVYVLLSMFVFYLILNYSVEVLSAISTLLTKLSINSRTFNLLTANDILNDSNRNIKIEICLQSWNNMPLFGYGFLGDRQFLNGTYVHNYFIETITDFGFIVGCIIIIYVVRGTLKGFKNGPVYSFILILASYEMTHLMVSGSYLTSTLFYALLGVLFSLSLKKSENNTTIT